MVLALGEPYTSIGIHPLAPVLIVLIKAVPPTHLFVLDFLG